MHKLRLITCSANDVSDNLKTRDRGVEFKLEFKLRVLVAVRVEGFVVREYALFLSSCVSVSMCDRLCNEYTESNKYGHRHNRST